jgi:hypothetical protein
MAGVERRMLERDGGEVARATSIVRYAPGSNFSAHRHDAGEEFFVLEGVFSDENGDYPGGYYVRNPPGSRHVPSSTPGAVIFVKLRQMPAQETETVRINTLNPGIWRIAANGRGQARLFSADWEIVDLMRLPPNDPGTTEVYPSGVEIFVIEGGISAAGELYRAGSWLRFPAGTQLRLSSLEGALIYRKTGHLPHSAD